jgi:hypothetical protein
MAAKKKDPKPKKPKGEKARPDVKIEHFPQSLRCELTDDEILERSRRQSRLLSEKALKQEEIKGMTAHLKASVKQIDAEISKCTAEINDGACYREVQCERRFIYRTGKVVEVRMDTNAVTFERAMTGPERQLPLPKPKATTQTDTTKEPEQAPPFDFEKEEATEEATEEAIEEPVEGDGPPESTESEDQDHPGETAAE